MLWGLIFQLYVPKVGMTNVGSKRLVPQGEALDSEFPALWNATPTVGFTERLVPASATHLEVVFFSLPNV